MSIHDVSLRRTQLFGSRQSPHCLRSICLGRTEWPESSREPVHSHSRIRTGSFCSSKPEIQIPCSEVGQQGLAFVDLPFWKANTRRAILSCNPIRLVQIRQDTGNMVGFGADTAGHLLRVIAVSGSQVIFRRSSSVSILPKPLPDCTNLNFINAIILAGRSL